MQSPVSLTEHRAQAQAASPASPACTPQAHGTPVSPTMHCFVLLTDALYAPRGPHARAPSGAASGGGAGPYPGFPQSDHPAARGAGDPVTRHPTAQYFQPSSCCGCIPTLHPTRTPSDARSLRTREALPSRRDGSS